MQITPLPLTVPPTVSAETMAKTAASVQAQAMKPILQRAVDPSAKSERGHQSRSNGDKAKGGDKSGDNRGGSLNIRV